MKISEIKPILMNKQIAIDDSILFELEELMNSTLDTNEKFNLTAIKDKETFVEKMILDSALGLEGLSLDNKSCIDIGTGGGFPGMVLYILSKNSNFTLLDSTGKKINYLKEYCDLHNYKTNPVNDRAENYARNNREKFDFVFIRAVASLNILLELCIPLLKVGGTLIAYKGSDYENEIKASKTSLNKLSCSVEKIISCELPESKEPRVILHIKKNKETNTKYPRDYSDIKKKPL